MKRAHRVKATKKYFVVLESYFSSEEVSSIVLLTIGGLLRVHFTFLVLILFSCGKAREQKKTDNFSKLYKSFSHILAGDDFFLTIDKARTFVNENSTHSIKFTICDTMNCLDELARETNRFFKDKTNPPRMLCSHRGLLTRMLLEKRGYKTRRVNLLNRRNGGHVFLEVRNPETKEWVVIDSDYNVFYYDGKKRLSLKEIISMPVSTYRPCSEKGCGWNIKHSRDTPPVSSLRDNDYYGVGFISGRETYFSEEKFKAPFDREWLKKVTKYQEIFHF